MIKRRPWRYKRITRDCPICGKPFMVRRCHRHVKTCSPGCGYKYRKKFTKAMKPGERIQKKCPNCLSYFEVLKNCKKQNTFCNKECYLEFISKHAKHPQNTRLQRFLWINIRRRILRRDNGLCVLCGNQGKEIHHKIPFSISGDDSDDNLIALCKGCHLHIHNIIRKGKKFNYKPIKVEEEGLVLMLELQE